MNKPVVLICDDNESVHQVLTLYLEQSDYEVVSAYDGETAISIFRRQKIDLIILDIMLPHLLGTEVCRELRKNSSVPIIFLSARGIEADRINGLELGADDYVSKPFSAREVLIRVKAVLRRTQAKNESAFLRMGNLEVDENAYNVRIDGTPIKMTPREIELLAFLIRHAGRVVSRDAILNKIWGQDYYGGVRTVDTLTARLRGKLSEYPSGAVIRSVYGVGYMIESE